MRPTPDKMSAFMMQLKKKMNLKSLVVTLAAIVVFTTTYLLILPAFTLDKEEAAEQGGIDVVAVETAADADQVEEAVQPEEAAEPKEDVQSEATAEPKEDTEKGEAANKAEDSAKTDDSGKAEAAAKPDVKLLTQKKTIIAEQAKGDNFEVSAVVDKDAKVPADVTITATELDKKTEDFDYDQYKKDALEALKKDSSDVKEIKSIKFYDISLESESQDESVEPEAPVNVKIAYEDGMKVNNADNIRIVHFAEQKNGEEKAVVLDADENKVETATNANGSKVTEASFETDGFSKYAVVEVTLETKVITADGKTYTVEVTYGDDAQIPAGAELKAEEIAKGTDEYEKYLAEAKESIEEEVTDEIETSAAKGDGKTADPSDDAELITDARFFDISIEANGEKVEPAAPVKVSIKYEDELKIEDTQKVSAVHFAKSGTEIIDVKAEKNDKGIKEVIFEQSSFSVTGNVVQYLSGGWPDNGDYVMIVKPYNSNNYYAVKNDGEITSVKYNSNAQTVTFSDLTSVDQVDDYWWTKSNSYYNGWKYLTNGNSYLDPNSTNGISSDADSVARTTNGNIYNQSSGYYTAYNYLLVNENSLHIEGQGSYNSSNRAVVFFANNFTVDEIPEPGEDPSEVDLGAPGTGKTIKSNDDGTYQLALSVTGKSQAQDKKSTADVLVVIDTSGSMTAARMSSEVAALRTLASALLNNNSADNPDTVRLKLMTFSSVVGQKGLNNNRFTYYDNFDWVTGSGTGASFNNGYSDFDDQLETLNSSGSGGTNWEDALHQANDTEMRSDAAKYVIFVSDGNPTFRNTQTVQGQNWNDHREDFYYNRYGLWGTGLDNQSYGDVAPATTISRCYQLARIQAKAIVDAGKNFYTLGVFDDNINYMSYLTAYAYTGNNSGAIPAGHYQKASSDNIAQAFQNIVNDINKNFSYTDVEIDDGITALTATALVTGTVNNYEYKITYVDALDNQKHTVNAVKNEDGTVTIPGVTYNVKNADGTTKSVTTNRVTVKGASYDGEKVIWELDKSDGTNYKLENGWTYEVSFTVWPTQRAYDLIADLANGNIRYADLSDEEKASIDQATLTLKTNSEANVTYRQITTTNGVDGEPSEPKTVGIDNPPGVPLAGSDLKIVKHWEDDLDPTQLLDLLTDHLNADGTDVDYTVTLDVVQDKGTAAQESVHTADYPDGFVFKPNVTVSGGKVTAATWPEIDIAVAPGIMVSAENAQKHGFDTAVDDEGNPKYETIEYGGVTYYVIEKGHRYEITERSVDYHFEMMTDIDHLMIIDGVLKNVIFNEDGTEIQEISQNPSNLTELGATNGLKGGINLYKYVEDAEGNKITPKDDVFTVKCKMTDKDGNPYTRSSETVGDNESDGIVYRVYAPDADLATVYPGKVDTGKNRTVKIGVTNSSEFNVQLKAGWSIRFINVPSDTKWEFEEINIPTGYTLDTTGTEEVDGHVVPKTRGMSGTALINTANDAQITNKLTSQNIELLKVEQGTGTVDAEGNLNNPTTLTGVEFIIQSNNEGDTKDKYIKSIENGVITWDSSKDNAYKFTTDADGQIDFGKIPLGSYTMTEIKTADGYNLLSESVPFEVTANGVTYTVNGQPKAGKRIETEGKISFQMIIPNSAGTELPHTGGIGTTIFYILGSLLVVGCGIMLISRRRTEAKK